MDILSELSDKLGTTKSSVVAHEHEQSRSEPPRSHTALQVDLWGERRGQELSESEWNAEHKHAADVLSDCHTSCFEPEPVAAERTVCPERSAWFRQLMETPEYHSLRSQTVLDDTMSELAAAGLANQWSTFSKENHEPQNPDSQGPNGKPGGDEEPIEKTLKRIRSTAQAIERASKDVKDAQGIAAGLGMGEAGSPLNVQDLLNVFKQVRNSDLLRQICERAGRYRTFAASLQRKKVLHGTDDMVGITMSDNIRRLMPSETLRMAFDGLDIDLLVRLSQRQAVCRDYRGVENVAKGPIVVVVDESGSMSGNKIRDAKAIALTLGWIARQQKRWIAFVGFSGGTEGTRLAFPPGKWDQEKLIDWLTHFYGGGTTLDVPLDSLPNVYWPELGCPKGKTDIIIVTDAEVDCPDETRDTFLDWKAREQAKCYGIVIGSQSPGDLATVCDQTWCVTDLDMDTDAVQSVLSI